MYLKKKLSAYAFYLFSSLSFLIYFFLLPLRYLFPSFIYLSPYSIYSPPLIISPPIIWFLLFILLCCLSPAFWHLCQRVYTFLKKLSRKLLWSTIIFLRALSQLSNATSSDFNWIAISATKWTKPSNVERLESFFERVLA